MKTHVFAGSRYKIQGVDGLPVGDLGQCDFFTQTLSVPVEGDTLPELDCLIHESLHACMPALCEDIINDSATSIAKFLWRLGWRKSS